MGWFQPPPRFVFLHGEVVGVFHVFHSQNRGEVQRIVWLMGHSLEPKPHGEFVLFVGVSHHLTVDVL